MEEPQDMTISIGLWKPRINGVRRPTIVAPEFFLHAVLWTTLFAAKGTIHRHKQTKRTALQQQTAIHEKNKRDKVAGYV